MKHEKKQKMNKKKTKKKKKREKSKIKKKIFVWLDFQGEPIRSRRGIFYIKRERRKVLKKKKGIEQHKSQEEKKNLFDCVIWQALRRKGVSPHSSLSHPHISPSLPLCFLSLLLLPPPPPSLLLLLFKLHATPSYWLPSNHTIALFDF